MLIFQHLKTYPYFFIISALHIIMSTNQGPEYFAAEKRYLQAKTDEEKIYWLEEMIKNFKKHKGSENMLANIKQRLKKFQEKKERIKKSGKITKKSIRKEGYQCAL